MVTLASGLKGTSFRKRKHKRRRRLMVDVFARDGRGKTHFGLDVPQPVLFMSIDAGSEGVIEKFADREIWDAGYSCKPNPYDSHEERVDKAEAEWKRVRNDWLKGLVAGAGCITQDTSGEFYELLRIARFGKFSEVPSHYYGIVKREWDDLIKMVYDSEFDTSLVMLHKMKKKYEGKDWNGDWEPHGYEGDRYICQVSLELEYDDDTTQDHVVGTIRKCRDRRDLIGEELYDPNIGDLAELILGIPADEFMAGEEE